MENAEREALFKEVVDIHMGIVLKTAHGFAAGAADRDDLAQEILLALWQALPAYNGRCRLSTFLYRVAHNRALNWRRTRNRYDRKVEDFADMPQLRMESGETADQQRRLDWLYAVIGRLPPFDRSLLMLQLDGLPHREIAEVTGLSETNVGVRLHRIRQWLADQTTGASHEP